MQETIIRTPLVSSTGDRYDAVCIWRQPLRTMPLSAPAVFQKRVFQQVSWEFAEHGIQDEPAMMNAVVKSLYEKFYKDATTGVRKKLSRHRFWQLRNLWKSSVLCQMANNWARQTRQLREESTEEELEELRNDFFKGCDIRITKV